MVCFSSRSTSIIVFYTIFQGQNLMGYSPWGSQRVGHDWVTNTFTFNTIFYQRKKIFSRKQSTLLNADLQGPGREREQGKEKAKKSRGKEETSREEGAWQCLGWYYTWAWGRQKHRHYTVLILSLPNPHDYRALLKKQPLIAPVPRQCPLRFGSVSWVAQTVKNLPAVWETWVWSQGQEDSLEEGMAPHSSILAWRIPMDRGALRATVYAVAKSQTWLSV